MKSTRKIIIVVLITIIVVITGLMSYIKLAYPNVGKAEVIKVEANPVIIDQGKYLANSVFVCMDCHSKRDWTKFAGPVVVGTLGQGGEEFNQKIGFPGKYFAKNITPYGIQHWTDGEILRAISCGVDKKGNPLFPVMPYLNYGNLDRKDLYAIIAYLRTLPGIINKVPDSESDFPMNIIIHTIPHKALYSMTPDKNNKIRYGRYLTTAAGCSDCHTQQKRGKPVPGMDFAGGFRFPLITGWVVTSANITPDLETGIGAWTVEAFVFSFKSYSFPKYVPTSIGREVFNSYMPWTMYSTMQPDDLKAIYTYLRTLKPVKNKITKFIRD
jgi:hypothetical protein